MTDEEMAEEYADWYWGASPSAKRAIKDGYLAGLKAGRPKWHKVADGDLPEYQMGENYAQIPCLCKIKNYGLGVRLWNIKEQCWDTEDGDDYYCEKDRVIEWQEIHSDDWEIKENLTTERE